MQDRSGSNCAGEAAGTQYAASDQDPGPTLHESFHTFDALHENHKQIVLTANRKPHEISDIADRLRTRFAWGLLADLEPPELEVRIAILRKKAAVEAVALPDDVAM